jgi:predicted MFS family arabinose efflux permease
LTVRAGRPTGLMVSSWLWHLTRWDGLFLGTYLDTHLGGPPIANQLVGVSLFAPMLLGAYVTSRTRHDVDPRRLVLGTQLVLLPVSLVMTALVASGTARIWMVHPFELAYGFGGMVNMTAQRELLFRFGGPERTARLLNVELAGLAGATMLGPLLGGVVIQRFGLGAAFAVPTVLLACSAALMARVGAGAAPAGPTAPTAVETAPVGRGLLRRSPALSAILLVTVICNVCYFAFMPLVPVISRDLGAGAATAGVIGSAAGAVQLLTAGALVVLPLRRPGRAYVAGVALCLCCLGVLALAPAVAVAVLALAVAGVGQALFGTTQALLPVAAVAPGARPAVLGLLSTTIGLALPGGMLALGVTSTLLGARPAMLVSALVGLAALAATLLASPRLLRTAQPPATVRRSGGPVRRRGEGDPVAAQPELG